MLVSGDEMYRSVIFDLIRQEGQRHAIKLRRETGLNVSNINDTQTLSV